MTRACERGSFITEGDGEWCITHDRVYEVCGAVAAERERITREVEALAMEERDDRDPEVGSVIWQRNDVVARVLAIVNPEGTP